MRKFTPLSDLWEDEAELPFTLTNFFLEDVKSSYPADEDAEEEYRALFTDREERQDFYRGE